MSVLTSRLANGPPLLLDGGLGAMLMARGLTFDVATESWNIERPREVAAVHRAYVEAGAEAIHTNTFGGNAIRLAHFGLESECDRLNQAAVGLARESGARFVFGDVGPTGETRSPLGKGDPSKWHAAFCAQGAALADAGVDAFHIETMSDVQEALVALRALQEVAPQLPVLVSLTFDCQPRGFFTRMGDPLEKSLRSLAEQGAAAVGANCTLTSTQMSPLASLAVQATGAPIVLQPSAGLPEATEDGFRYAQRPETFAAEVAAMVEVGARVVGGCCGTDPAFIAALRERLAGT